MSNNHSQLFQIISAIAVVSSLIVILVTVTFCFRIKAVHCILESTDSNCPTEVLAELHTLKGSRLLFNRVNQHINKSSVITQRFQVQAIVKNLFGEVTIILKSLDTPYSLNIEDKIYLVTNQGSMILSNQEKIENTTSGCVVRLPKVADVNQDTFKQTEMLTHFQVNQELHQQVGLLIQGLNSRGLGCEQINPLNQNTWLLTFPSSNQVVINPIELDTNLDRLVQVLSMPLTKADREELLYLDVRFSMPVLRKSL